MWMILAGTASAATLRVGPAQAYGSIAAAIAAATDGDEILVEPGVWAEGIDPNGRRLTIRSAAGAAATLVAPPSGVTAYNADDAEGGTFEGFTILPTNARGVRVVGGNTTLTDLVIDGAGRSTLDGGGIRIEGGSAVLQSIDITDPVGQRGGGVHVMGGASVTVDAVTVRGARAGWGGGFYVVGSTVLGTQLTIESPATTGSGSGMYLDAGAIVVVTGLSITDAVGTFSHGVGAYLQGGSRLRMDGGEISGCAATERALGYDGGAIWADATSQAVVKNADLVDNAGRYGGAISSLGGVVTLDNVAVLDNAALLDGGAVYASGAPISTVNSVFDGNTGRAGGAIRLVAGASLLDTGSVFSANDATTNGGAIAADSATSLTLNDTSAFANEAFGAGGAIYAANTPGGVTATGARLSDNRAIAGAGGGIAVGAATPVTVTGGAFERNHADAANGGAIAFQGTFGASDLRLTTVLLRDNTAGRAGGAISAVGTDDTVLTDVNLLRNTADTDGGALLVDGANRVQVIRVVAHDNLAFGDGGAILERNTTLPALYANVSFVENQARNGGGLALQTAATAEITNVTFAANAASVDGGHMHVSGGSIRLVNTVLALAVDGGGVWGDATAASSDVYYGLVWANAGGSWVGSMPDPFATSGNGNADPLFRAFSIDGNEVNDDLRLALGSPAIDTGDPSLVDVDGSRSDIGAWGGPRGYLIDLDGDGVYAHADCNDADPTQSPLAVEIPYDGVDQDCDGFDPTDLDGDGFDGGDDGPDCNDNNAAINPAAGEVWYDGIDKDCDGRSDYDADLDGFDAAAFGGTDCNDVDPAIGPHATEIWYDGVDQDCSGGSDYDRDGDGRDSDAYSGSDCNDNNAAIYPGAPELCDHLDNDCNGLDDDDPVNPATFWIDNDGDGFGDENNWTTACFSGTGLVTNALDCDDTNARIHPDATERWYDGVDQDCDGRDDDQDGDGFVRANDCDDLRPEAYPGAAELFNGLDDDCDGFDELYDRDEDGLADWYEWQSGTDYLNPDSDGDGWNDGNEAGDPTNPRDTDNDGTIDALDTDDDGDGIPTDVESTVDIDGDKRPDIDVDRDGTPNHLDLDTDGDGYLDIDEGVRDRDGDDLPDFADYQGPLVGGGCDGCSGTGVPGTPWFLAPFVGLVLRRRRSLLAAALALPGTALAQADEGASAHGYDLFGTTSDPRAGQRLTEGGQGEVGGVIALVVDQANRPIVEVLPTGPDPVIEHLTTGNVVVSLTPLERLRLDAVMPVHVLGVGSSGTFTTPGDLRLGAQVAIANRRGAIPGLSLLGMGFIPTGTEGFYVGAPTASGGVMLSLSERIGKFGWTLNAGARIAPERERRGVPVGPGPLGGFGIHLAPRPELALLAEVTVDGTTGWTELPIEASGGLRGRGAKGRFWTVTAGAGLTDAVGASAWRVAVGGGFGPKVKQEIVLAEAPIEALPPEPTPYVVVVQQPLAELIDNRIVVSEQVFFKEASDVILSESDDVLDAVRAILQEHTEIQYLLIEGHTNHRGSAAYNEELSLRRAESVRRWFVDHGIAKGRLLCEGYGFNRPLVPSDHPDAFEANRRVEFVVVRPDEPRK